MRSFAKRCACAAVAFVLTLCVFIGAVPVYAETTVGTGYTASGDVVYTKSDKGYVANWGYRGETCSFLSPMANSFYTNDTYDELSALDGGTGTSDAAQSDLFSALHNLMAKNHETLNSYGDSRYLFPYTDCQLGATDTIISFYSGESFNSQWDKGTTWNREHVWPASKCLNSDREDTGKNESTDIMMLRPTLISENTGRSNDAYGTGTDYFTPDESIRGDVARIFLYMYVRWEMTEEHNVEPWGKSGVMESISVLLQWMYEDPVDTWEMGRNDAVESITGTRNVFVDYPELAWLLFGEEIPADMTTPSESNAETVCEHKNTVHTPYRAATCVEDGTEEYYTCKDCKRVFVNAACTVATTVAARKIVATGAHTYENGVCSGCGAKKTSNGGWQKAESFADRDKIVILAQYDGKFYAMANTIHKNGYAEAIELKSADGQPIISDASEVTWILRTAGNGTFYLEGKDGKQLKVNKTALSTDTKGMAFTVSAEKIFADSGRRIMLYDSNGSIRFKNYSDQNVGQANYSSIVLYKACVHEWAEATCTAPKTCTLCGETEGAALGHDYTETVTEPTCAKGGYTTHTCALCGDSYVDSETEPTGVHTYGQWQIITQPTVDASGEEKRVCSVCDNAETRAIDKLPAGTPNEAPAETPDGSNTVTIIVISVVAVCLIGGAVIVIVRKKH